MIVFQESIIGLILGSRVGATFSEVKSKETDCSGELNTHPGQVKNKSFIIMIN